MIAQLDLVDLVVGRIGETAGDGGCHVRSVNGVVLVDQHLTGQSIGDEDVT